MRRLRQVIASIILLLSSLYICNIAGFLPHWINPKFIIDIQIVPAILSTSIVSILALTALTFLLGRFYCSAICPLGITQDLIIRFSSWVKKKRKIKRRKPYFKSPQNILRYTILAISIITLLLGSSYLVLLLDPYSIFGRFSALILTPIIAFINNTIAHFTNAAGNYALTMMEYNWTSSAVFLTSIITIGTITYMNVKHYRLWCNTICPVGTLLGIFSQLAFFKIKIDSNKCIDCKACAKECKSNTIDNTNNYAIDHSRCVACYNCIDACKFDALKLKPYSKAQAKRETIH